MESVRELLLEVWREACRHLDINESLETLFGIVSRRVMIESVSVYRLPEEDADSLHLLAEAGPLLSGEESSAHFQTGDCAALRRWCRRGELKLIKPGGSGRSAWSELTKQFPRPGTLVGGLVFDGQPIALAVFSSKSGKPTPAQGIAALTAILEPLAVAVENSRRLHELNTLRSAAEEDRRAALTRLGRESLAEDIIGAQRGLRPVMERVHLVHNSDVPVLILGETGSGKEVIARAIHNDSSRRQGPFVRVNCGAIPPELIDSQLFGHERGAFTGATDRRPGWFERADGGTLFLDEIGELPLAAQVRFLRVLQDGMLERVGGAQSLHVDCRMVAATHRDLLRMVQEGTFREDLWYRLSVFPIVLPPLRERLEDMPDLVCNLVKRAALRFRLAEIEPTAADIDLLCRYHWPGNIRELAAVIDRAVILGEGQSLAFDTALGTPSVSPASPPSDDAPPRRGELNAISSRAMLTLEQAMRGHIERALMLTHGRIEGRSGAANILGINPHTLRSRMRKLKLEWRQFRTA